MPRHVPLAFNLELILIAFFVVYYVAINAFPLPDTT
jgi:hypothetical protein